MLLEIDRIILSSKNSTSCCLLLYPRNSYFVTPNYIYIYVYIYIYTTHEILFFFTSKYSDFRLLGSHQVLIIRFQIFMKWNNGKMWFFLKKNSPCHLTINLLLNHKLESGVEFLFSTCFFIQSWPIKWVKMFSYRDQNFIERQNLNRIMQKTLKSPTHCICNICSCKINATP